MAAAPHRSSPWQPRATPPARAIAPLQLRRRFIATPTKLQRPSGASMQLRRRFIAALVTLHCSSGDASTTPRASLQLRRPPGDASSQRRRAPSASPVVAASHRRAVELVDVLHLLLDLPIVASAARGSALRHHQRLQHLAGPLASPPTP